MRRECLDHVVVFGERTPASRAAVVHEISQRRADAFIFGEGCPGLARRRTSRSHFLPPNSRRATPPIYPDLIYDRHRISINQIDALDRATVLFDLVCDN